MTSGQAAHTQIDIRRSTERFHTQIDWLNSHHCFSFADHYDPQNTHHGLLLVSNDDVVKPGTGFRTHPHRRHGDCDVGPRRANWSIRTPREISGSSIPALPNG